MSEAGRRSGVGRPVPTRLAVALLAAGVAPAVLALADPGLGWLVLALDAAVLVLCGVDFVLAPTLRSLSVRRDVEPILSSGAWHPVTLVLELRGRESARVEVRDTVPGGPSVDGQRQSATLSAAAGPRRLTYRILPHARGDLAFGDLWVRLLGPLGLCARQQRIPLSQAVKVYPDLAALTRDALALALAAERPADRSVRRPSEGSEFESLREYRTGDDARTIDWKATARRAKVMVRSHQPERNQSVILLLDCGRHMSGRVQERRKLDFAVDAALRLAKVSLDKGDLVGLVAFASEVRSQLPARKGTDHLRELTTALYRAEAALEESDYGRAMDAALARHHKRALLVLFTDVADPDTSAQLLKRTLALRPRHLPLVVSLTDVDLERAASVAPATVQDAYVRQTAARLEGDYRLTHRRLREAGALSLRAPPAGLSAAAINEYLRVKAQGLL